MKSEKNGTSTLEASETIQVQGTFAISPCPSDRPPSAAWLFWPG
jgi:hypothetical protein